MPNSTETITEWVNQYTDEMIGWATIRLKQQSLAEDLVQDTFISALKNFENFKGKSSPKTWLYSILKNKIADHFRSKVQKLSVNETSINNGGTNFFERFFDNDDAWKLNSRPDNWNIDEEVLLDNQDFNLTLKACMEQLGEKSMLSIQYKYLRGMNGKVICQELDITPSNFWQLMHRAKLQLRECLEINWFSKND